MQAFDRKYQFMINISYLKSVATICTYLTHGTLFSVKYLLVHSFIFYILLENSTLKSMGQSLRRGFVYERTAKFNWPIRSTSCVAEDEAV